MKFFNKIRFQMIKGKQLRNYLVYAIGEIILVVIGILIALYINDVQKDNSYEANEKELLKDIQAQLIKDKADINKFIEGVKKRNLDYAYFKKDRPKNSEFPFLYELDRSPLKIDPVVVSSISNFVFRRSEISLKLNQLLTNYKYAQKNIERIENEMHTIYMDYTNYLGTKYDWHIGYSFEDTINIEGSNYILKSNEYKGFIARLNTISSKSYIIELEALSELIVLEIYTVQELLKSKN